MRYTIQFRWDTFEEVDNFIAQDDFNQVTIHFKCLGQFACCVDYIMDGKNSIPNILEAYPNII